MLIRKSEKSKIVLRFIFIILAMQENKNDDLNEQEEKNESLANQNAKDKDAEKDALELVKKTKTELAAYRKSFEKNWKIYDNAYYGKQHKTGENKKTVKNHIFKIIEVEVPILTDSMPGTQITAHTQESQDDADNLNKAIKYVFQDNDLPLILPSVIRSSLISGPGYLYSFYNPDAENGDGKIEIVQVDWKHVWLDGNKPRIEQSDCAIIEIPMRRGALARTWPDKKDQILEKSGDNSHQGDDQNAETRDITARGEVTSGMPKDFSSEDVVNYTETWVRCYDLTDIDPKEVDEAVKDELAQIQQGNSPDVMKWQNHAKHIEALNGLRGQLLAHINMPPDTDFDDAQAKVQELMQQNPQAEQLRMGLAILKICDNTISEYEELQELNPTGQEPKYPDNWRVIKTCGEIILYDGPNPEQSGHIPLVPFHCYKDNTIYGFGEVKNVLDAQQTLNDVDFREFENLKLGSNSGWIVDYEAEVDENSLTNAPGIVVQKNKGTQVERLAPVQVSPQLERRKELDQRAIEAISGMNEATQGISPSPDASGVAIEQLQTQAVGRIRLKDRHNNYYSMRRLALLVANLIKNHWTQEKRLRLRDDNTNIEEFIFNPIKIQNLEYTIDIAPGSMAGISKDALNALMMKFLAGQFIDFETFLKVADFPKREILLKLVQDKNTQDQQIQQMQAQAQDLQKQNIMIKGQLAPGLLSNEERRMYEQLRAQQLTQKVTNGEPVAPHDLKGVPNPHEVAVQALQSKAAKDQVNNQAIQDQMNGLAQQISQLQQAQATQQGSSGADQGQPTQPEQ